MYCFNGIKNGIYFCIGYDWVNGYLYLVGFVGQYILIDFIGDRFGILLIYIEEVVFVGVGIGVIILGLYFKFIIEQFDVQVIVQFVNIKRDYVEVVLQVRCEDMQVG